MAAEKRMFIDSESGEIFENADLALQARAEKQEMQRQKDLDKNPPFIQLTKGLSPGVLAKIASKSGTAIEILMFFFENMDNGNVVVVSQQTIADCLEKSRRSIATSIKILEEHGTIGIGKIGNANAYIINPNVAWTQANKQRKVAVMKGTILLGKSENEKLFKKFNDLFHGDSSYSKNLKLDSLSTKVVKTKETREQESLPQVLKRVKDEDRELDEQQKLYEEFENAEEEELVYPE